MVASTWLFTLGVLGSRCASVISVLGSHGLQIFMTFCLVGAVVAPYLAIKGAVHDVPG